VDGLPLGLEGVRLVKEQFHAALYIKAALGAGFLRTHCSRRRRAEEGPG